MINLESAAAYLAATSPGFLTRMDALECDSAFVQDAYRRAISFTRRYTQEHRSSPGARLVGEFIGFDLDPCEAEEDFVLDGLRRIALSNLVQGRRNEIDAALKRGDADAAFEKLTEPLAVPVRTRVQQLSDVTDAVKALYAQAKSGEIDIPTPWPTMTRSMRGFRRSAVTMIVARSAVGKSQALMVIGHHLSLRDSRCLIVSPEMSKEDLAERFYTLEARIPGMDVLHGELAHDHELRYMEALDMEIRSAPHVMDYDDAITHSGIREAVMDLRPPIVLVDSFYRLLPPANGRRYMDRKEKFEANVAFLLKLAKDSGSAVVCTSQQNRGGIGAAEPDQDVVAISDEAVWDIQYIYAMRQDKDMLRDRVMEFIPLKIRRGRGSAFKARWDFDVCNFSELTDDGELPFVDEDFGNVPF